MSKNLTDFWDLRDLCGPAVVRAQIEAKLVELGMPLHQAAAVAPVRESGPDTYAAKPRTAEDFRRRFIYVHARTPSYWDKLIKEFVSVESVRHLAPNNAVFREFHEHPDRDVITTAEINFDPVGDMALRLNLFDSAAMVKADSAGTCDLIRELYRALCPDEETFEWCENWDAWRVQTNDKADTSILFVGPQGSGKSTITKVQQALSDPYSGVFSVRMLENMQHNDWLSQRLLLEGTEWNATKRPDLAGTLRELITAPKFWINPKNLSGRWEGNRANFVFTSNHLTSALDIMDGDRRFMVVQGSVILSPEFFRRVNEEIRDGGIAAYKHFLLHHDLKGFDGHTKPIATTARAAMIAFQRDSIQCFVDAYFDGDLGEIVELHPCPRKKLIKIENIDEPNERAKEEWWPPMNDGEKEKVKKEGIPPPAPLMIIRAADLYLAYTAYCRATGVRYAEAINNFMAGLVRDGRFERERLHHKEFTGRPRDKIVPRRKAVALIPKECLQDWEARLDKEVYFAKEIQRAAEMLRKAGLRPTNVPQDVYVKPKDDTDPQSGDPRVATHESGDPRKNYN